MRLKTLQGNHLLNQAIKVIKNPENKIITGAGTARTEISGFISEFSIAGQL
jgi:hypothetical protein